MTVIHLEDRAQAERDRLADELEVIARRVRQHDDAPIGVAVVVVVDGGKAIETTWSGRAYASMIGGCWVLARRVEAAMDVDTWIDEDET